MAGDLRDQLLKAGLVSQKRARAAEQVQRAAERVKRRQGRGAVEDEVGPARPRSPQDQARVDARIRDLLAQQRLGVEVRGPRRWYFEARNGRLPFLPISEVAARMMERGEAALVEGPAGETALVQPAGAERIADLDPRWIRCWRRSGSGALRR